MTFKMILTLLVGAIIFNTTVARVGHSQTTQNNREADAAAIRAHIESIFQAFIDGDEEKIFATHSEDWRGFLGDARGPIKGIDEYMKANGIEWPRPANSSKSNPYYPPGTGYKLSDFDVHFYSPELALASFNGAFIRNVGNTSVTLRRFRIMDVYAKRKGSWIQVASYTGLDPEWRSQEMSKPRTVAPEFRQEIFTAREAVWKAWFTNDRAALEKLIPEETIAIDGGSATWSDRKAIFASAQQFAESGGKLIRLEFPKTEMQVYGNTIIIYTTFVVETEVAGKRNVQSGRATEMFVQRGDTLINVGWHLDSGNKK
jgi:hypothetical protein